MAEVRLGVRGSRHEHRLVHRRTGASEPGRCLRAVREATGLSDSMVSKHSHALEDAGYIEIRKGGVGRRPRTWFRMTPLGQTRYSRHVAALQRLLRREPDQDTNSGA
ncbi:transcriptional regulator [Streptomyces sp. NPDC090442]|uniref:transcriptional regulator n=1 Tax=Streptomyces sp. NPDC090442 TaxID=3365962 RepID=UPI00381CBE7C